MARSRPGTSWTACTTTSRPIPTRARAPCVQAAKGERMAGLALDMRGARRRAKGAPIEIILPKESTGWELEATAIVKGTKNLELAKKVADWGASKARERSSIRRLCHRRRPEGSEHAAELSADAETGA